MRESLKLLHTDYFDVYQLHGLVTMEDLETCFAPEMLLAAMKYSVSLGADVLIPPGNFAHFQFAVNHIDEVLERPLTEDDRALLSARLPFVKEYPFYEPECY